MNLALGVLIIFILSLPGFVFRQTYFSSYFSKRTVKTSTVEEIFISLLPATFIHIFFILVIRVFGYTINFQFIFELITGSVAAKDINLLNGYLPWFTLYLTTNLGANALSAYGLRRFVLKKGWDRQHPVFAIYNEWYYMLSNGVGDQPEDSQRSVWLDVLVETKNDMVLYCGILNEYTLDANKEIKELRMSGVRRRYLSKDTPIGNNPSQEDNVDALSEEVFDERYYFIPGNQFIISMKEIKNLNITYYSENDYNEIMGIQPMIQSSSYQEDILDMD